MLVRHSHDVVSGCLFRCTWPAAARALAGCVVCPPRFVSNDILGWNVELKLDSYHGLVICLYVCTVTNRGMQTWVGGFGKLGSVGALMI